jgi:phosphoglycerate kinase
MVLSIQDIPKAQLHQKRVLVRVDFNVPMHDGQVQSDQRIRAALPTIRFLQEQQATIILMSHLGRPKGQVKEELRLAPVGDYLSKLLETPVISLSETVGEAVQSRIAEAKPGEGTIFLLENTRFHAEETQNDAGFAQQLAALADVYVNDAFGAAHRAHASTEGVAKFLPAYAGLLLKREIEALSQLANDPKHPFVAVIGGAKVSSKLGVLEHLLPKVDVLIIGGAMAYTFLAAQGISVMNSLVEPELYETALQLLAAAETHNTRIVLPEDTVLATSVDADDSKVTVVLSQLSDDQKDALANLTGVDIGPASIEAIGDAFDGSQTIFWNGPMGVFENPAFCHGTEAVARMIAERTADGALSVVGGGDSVAAVEKLDLAESFSHVSTGGGASLEFLEGKTLPGIAALQS